MNYYLYFQTEHNAEVEHVIIAVIGEITSRIYVRLARSLKWVIKHRRNRSTGRRLLVQEFDATFKKFCGL